MSGICGILRWDGAAPARADVERMLAAQAHRAPDRRDTWSGDAVALGHGLMRVTWEDDYDRQPLRSAATGAVIVADARLDNREALAAELGIGAEALARMPDSALLLAAYDAWQDACVDRLIGDFAFAVWDPAAPRLLLARDHMGQRGVHIHRGAGYLAFSTDVSGILALPDAPRALNEATVARRLLIAPQWAVGATHLQGIDCLGAGRTLSVAADGAQTERCYWTPHAAPAHLDQSEADYVDAYRRVLEEAVACRLRRLARPAALALSGGFDSAAIAGLARACLPKGGKLVTVTAAAPAGEAGPADPRPWVEVCRRWMPHLDVRYFEGGRDVDGELERAFLEADGPVGAGHYVDRGLFEIARSARARVFLDGMGGDYTLNPRGAFVLASWLRKGRLIKFARELAALRRVSGLSVWQIYRRRLRRHLIPTPLVRLRQAVRRGFAPLWRTRLAADRFADEAIASGAVRVGDLHDPAAAAPGMREESLALCRQRQDYPPSERTVRAARYGLEHTRPFHDKRVVELGLAIPEDLQVRDGLNRYVARRALADIYPPEFQTRPGHQTAGAPDFAQRVVLERKRWLDGVCDLEQRPRQARYFNFGKLREAISSAPPEAAARAVNALLLARYVAWFSGDNA